MEFQIDDTEYRLQLWKGSYGYETSFGAEVGLYSRPISESIEEPYIQGSYDSLAIHYESLPENKQIDIKNEVYDSDGNLLISNDTAYYEDDYFWNLAISTDNLPNAKDDIYTITTLDIADEETRKIVIDALEQEDDIRDVKDLGYGIKFTWEN